MTDLPLTIATIDKNKAEQVRVVLDQYRGTNTVDMRVFATFSAAAVPMPTKKGLTCRVDLLPGLGVERRLHGGDAAAGHADIDAGPAVGQVGVADDQVEHQCRSPLRNGIISARG